MSKFEDGTRPFLTVTQLAQQCGISTRTVWRDIEQGSPEVHKFRTSTRISPEAADAYKASKKKRAPEDRHS